MGEVAFEGIPALFSELRIKRASVPRQLYIYEMRHAEDDAFRPIRIVEGVDKVRENFYGTLITTRPLVMPSTGIRLDNNPFDFSKCEVVTLDYFMAIHRVRALRTRTRVPRAVER
jgi:hypothetical protein